MKQQLTVRISDQMATRLEEAARRLHRRRSEVVRLALERYRAPTPFFPLFTLDRRGFSMYRLHGRRAFQILPP
jgi:hypothetical protein